jgi:8-oxo-dGTP pyrophosphatase MutT (NUDIX family)
LALDRVRDALAGTIDESVAGQERREAAVLVPLFEEDGETRVVLTRRASTLRSHRSEVAFPGGRAEPGEPLRAAALREAFEEVALEPGLVEIIASLGSLTTVSSGARVTPFVGVLSERPHLRASATEVERVFDISLAELLVYGVHRIEHWGVGPSAREIHFFDLPGDIVWGATARILTELLTRIVGQ